MKLYRICTENVNRDKVEAIVSSYVEGFTILDAIGYWNGNREASLIVEIAGEEKYLHYLIQTIALHIKQANKQEAVMVQSFDGESEMI